jgi:hypothetical protein
MSSEVKRAAMPLWLIRAVACVTQRREELDHEEGERSRERSRKVNRRKGGEDRMLSLSGRAQN